MYSKISSVLGSAMVTRYVNVNVAKWISVILISLIFIFNVLNYMDSGRDPCRGILKAGTLMDKEEAIWQPHGCMLHSYRTSEAQLCIKNKKIAFLGDSRHRELMFSFVHLLFPSHTLPTEKVHSDIHINNEDHKISLNFYWVPELNDTLRKIYQKWLDNEAESPSIVFQGAGVHTLKIHNGSHDAVIEYAKNFTSFLPMLEQLTKERQTKIFWIYQESVEESLLGASRKMITNEKLELYNEAIRDIASSDSSKIGITYIDVFRELSSKVIDLSKDGLHIPEKALHTCTNLLLNYFCNGKMKPIDGTCCQPAPPVTSVQVLVMIVLFLCILSAGALQITSYLQSRSKFEDVESGESKENLIENNVSGNSDEKKPVVDEKKSQIDTLLKLFLPLARYSIILFYFYFCDRTNIFMKANKHFTNARFFIPLLYISFLGLFGIIQTSQTALLNRDQTDEWKGWMQLIILIYHMSGASVNVPIYIHIRILVAMYLFMTGYGHFSYFWHKGDYSLYRVFNVLFRINFLTVSLCLIMDRPYQFYYFVPLCSFWFLVLYLTMSMWPRAHVKMLQADNNSSETTPNGSEKRYPFSHLNLTSPYALMTLKLILLFSAINLLFMSESYFEAIFSWWPAVRIFEFPAGSVREWWFRCQLDRFAMLFGAIFCFLYIILKKLSILDDSRQGCLISVKSSFISMSISIGIIITFVVWAAQCTDKVLCNRIHSYASIFPIAAFVIIRNVPGYLRSGYSAFFAWFGKISLELFIGQYHIWLAADTKGMLVLMSPEWPTLNLVVTTFIFVCVAHEINCVTGVIAKYLVGSPQDARIIGLQKVAVCISVICLISLLQQTFD